MLKYFGQNFIINHYDLLIIIHLRFELLYSHDPVMAVIDLYIYCLI